MTLDLVAESAPTAESPQVHCANTAVLTLVDVCQGGVTSERLLCPDSMVISVVCLTEVVDPVDGEQRFCGGGGNRGLCVL